MSNVDESEEATTRDVLLSGFENTNSAASFSEKANNQPVKPIPSLISRSANRRLNFDTHSTEDHLAVKSSVHSSVEKNPVSVFSSASFPLTPLLSASKASSKFSPTKFSSALPESVSTEEKQRLLQNLFVEFLGELERCVRISGYLETYEDGGFVGKAALSSVGHEAEAACRAAKNFSFEQLCDAYAALCYRKASDTRQLGLMQQLVSVSRERLDVSQAMLRRLYEFLKSAENSTFEILNEFREGCRRAVCTVNEFVEENSSLKEELQKSHEISQSFRHECDTVGETSRQLSAKLRDAERNLDKLRSEKESLSRDIELCERSNGTLKEKVAFAEEYKKKSSDREQESYKETENLKKMLQEANCEVQRLKNELTAEKASFRARLDESERLSKLRQSERAVENERRFADLRDEQESRRNSEVRRLKEEAERELKSYAILFGKMKSERDEALSRLNDFERHFDENSRNMYAGLQQRLTAKYYELVSEFAAPSAAGNSHSFPANLSAPGNNNPATNAIERRHLADEFLDTLDNAEILPTPRHVVSDQHSIANRAAHGRPENLQHFLKTFGKSQGNVQTPTDPPGKL